MIATKIIAAKMRVSMKKVLCDHWVTTKFLTALVIALAVLVMVLPTAAQEETTAGAPVVHVVQPGETLARIALRYGRTIVEIAQANEIVNYERIYIGQELVIPGLTIPDTSAEVVNPLVAVAPTIHIVQPGENLTLIAQAYGITVEQLMQANGLTDPNRINRGQELQVWSATTAAVETTTLTETDTAEAIDTTSPAFMQPETEQGVVVAPLVSIAQVDPLKHIVGYGETLAAIGTRYGVNWRDIATANGIINIDRIVAGQTLIIPGIAAPTIPVSPANIDNSFSSPAHGLGILDAPVNVLPAPPTITVGKQLVVDLSDQMVYAYNDGLLVYSVMGSTGLPATPTVQGDYKIYNRVPSQTMSGPGYWLPGVNWVQYFYQGYAFHTAYWHDNWGQPMSHGCVNLPEEAAKWLYDFATIGTPVHVQY